MATAAAAAVANARRNIQHEFFSRDAVRADRAIDFDPSRHVQRRVFERWKREGIVRQETNGLYWLDVVAYDVALRRRHARLRIVLLSIVTLLAISTVLALLKSGR